MKVTILLTLHLGLDSHFHHGIKDESQEAVRICKSDI